MTRVADLDFSARVVTFDDPAHPSGVILAATSALSERPTYTAYVRYPDGRYAWLASVAVWARDEHPWAVANSFTIDADAVAHAGGPRERRGGAELQITDDLEAGTRTLDPNRTPSRPARVEAIALRDGRMSTVWQLTIEDGATPRSPSTITVLDAGRDVASGLTLTAEPQLASRLRADGAPLRTNVGAAEEVVSLRARTRLPTTLIVARSGGS